MNVLLACEFSGRVRNAFTRRGHLAISCDVLGSTSEGWHVIADARDVILRKPPYDQLPDFDLLIAFPPCTYLTVSGALHFKDPVRQVKQAAAIDFVKFLLAAPIAHIAVENPVGVLSTQIRKPDQIIQPYMFGTPERKTTCLWLKNLPRLKATNNVKAELEALPKDQQNPLARLADSSLRSKKRSLTYEVVAEAMAEQWSELTDQPQQTGLFS